MDAGITRGTPRALEVTNLSTHIKLTRSTVKAVGNVDIGIDTGETLGLVGESGCGKSMLGLSILNLLPKGGKIIEGSVQLGGRELVSLRDSEMRKLRGNELAMIFQDSQSSLNPTKTIGEQVAEPVRLHRGASRGEANARALEVLELAGLPRPRERMGNYPHQLSGGLRQRVMIAIALACEPKVLLADEPTTALDVTIQAQILALLDDLEARLGMATLLVTHDMGVVAGRADRVSVMYAGRIVETGPTKEIFGAHAASLHAGTARLDPEAESRQPRGAGQHPRPAAGPNEPARRLSLRAALSARNRPMSTGGAAAERTRPGAPVRMLASRRWAGRRAAEDHGGRRPAPVRWPRRIRTAGCSRSRTWYASIRSRPARCSSARSPP